MNIILSIDKNKLFMNIILSIDKNKLFNFSDKSYIFVGIWESFVNRDKHLSE